MRVLGIDPGFGRCGVAIVEHINNSDTLLFSGCIETSGNNNFSERLLLVGSTISSLIQQYHPDEAAIELLFFSNNQKTALQVAEARGAILYVITSQQIPIYEYNPGEIKIALTGYGRATKNQITHMVQRLIKITHPITHDDEYDAIAAALTHTASRKTPR